MPRVTGLWAALAKQAEADSQSELADELRARLLTKRLVTSYASLEDVDGQPLAG